MPRAGEDADAVGSASDAHLESRSARWLVHLGGKKGLER